MFCTLSDTNTIICAMFDLSSANVFYLDHSENMSSGTEFIHDSNRSEKNLEKVLCSLDFPVFHGVVSNIPVKPGSCVAQL